MKITVAENFDGKTVGALLRAYGASGTLIKRIKARPHGLTVMGEDVTVRAVVRAGDTVFADDRDTFDDENDYVFPSEIPLSILYEDEDVFVIDKPAGMPTHTSHGHYADTLANAMCAEYRRRGIPFVFRAVNRLDADTSGAILLAKSKLAACKLARDIAERKIKKIYLAVLEGEIDLPAGCSDTIKSYIRRRSETIIVRESLPCKIDPPPGADYAETVYACIYKSNGHSVVAASPLTGRTHQLRVHFSSIGHPIEGDDFYGGKRERIGRQALHALFLKFHSCGEERRVFSPIPSDIEPLIEIGEEEVMDAVKSFRI